MAYYYEHYLDIPAAAMESAEFFPAQFPSIEADKGLDPSTNKWCIYKVPPKLRNKLDQDFYTPNVVSIGPFHNGDKHLQKMFRHKRQYYRRFIKEKSEVEKVDLFLHLRKLEQRVRDCYSEEIDLESDEFNYMIMVDCCFTIQFLLDFHSSIRDENSIKPWFVEDIHWDLLLIENQIPFFVFEDIYELAFKTRLDSGEQESFWELATFWILSIEKQAEGSEYDPEETVLHFTDLYRHCRLKPSRNRLPERGDESFGQIYSVTELKQAGVRFKVDKYNKCFLDLEFSDGYLTIPQLKVTDRTEMILRNMVAFEQCHYPKESYFTDYIVFLDFLINKENDVDILVKYEIIENLLGDSMAVATMFNGLGKFILLRESNTDYLRIRKDLKEFFKHPWHSRMATLRRDYFNTPWKMAASVGGIVLLILTIIQTICSVLQVNLN